MKNENEVFVDGMHCDTCEVYVEEVASKIKGVKSVSASSITSKLAIEFESGVNKQEILSSINTKISKQGYEIKSKRSKKIDYVKEYIVPFIAGTTIALLIYFIGIKFGDTNLITGELSIFSAMALGFIASISTCMAIVGGIAMTFSAAVSKNNKKGAIAYFHIARLVGFFFLGGVAGALGKIFVPSGYIATVLEIIVSILMIVVGLDMIGVKLPAVVFPKQISKMFGMFSDKDKLTDGMLLGIGTFFLPCGMTQAVQFQALSTGSFVQGSLIMGAFAIGSFPVLYLLSSGSSSIVRLVKSHVLQHSLAVLIIVTAVISLLGRLL